MCVHEWGVEDEHLIAAALYESDRVRLWHRRVNRETGERKSWLEALHTVANNPPDIDRLTADMYRQPRPSA